MGITASIATALDARLTSATVGIGVPVIKGWPDFDSPDFVRPSASILWKADEQIGPFRVSGGTAWLTEFACELYCQDEPRLRTYIDATRACFTGWQFDTIDSVTMDKITAGRIERIPQGETTINALRYAAQWTVTFEYKR